MKERERDGLHLQLVIGALVGRSALADGAMQGLADLALLQLRFGVAHQQLGHHVPVHESVLPRLHGDIRVMPGHITARESHTTLAQHKREGRGQADEVPQPNRRAVK